MTREWWVSESVLQREWWWVSEKIRVSEKILLRWVSAKVFLREWRSVYKKAI
jgi:hypothetical protein